MEQFVRLQGFLAKDTKNGKAARAAKFFSG
jgi:hypothetical protein